LIIGLVSAGTEYIETITGRAMVSGTLEYTRNDLPSSIPLPRNPVQSVVSVVLVDENGSETTVDPAIYDLDTTELPHRIVLKSSQSWPSITLANANAVRIRVVAGYGSSASVPETLKAAHKLFVSNFYEIREPVAFGTIAPEVPFSIKALLAPYRVDGWTA